MRELSPQARIYLVLVMIAGYLAMGELLHRSTAPSVTKLIILVLLAATCGPLRMRLPWLGAEPGRPSCPQSLVSLGLVFVFLAILELPARYAALVGMVQVVSQLHLGEQVRRNLREYLFVLSAGNLGLLTAYDTYYSLIPRWEAPAALMVAALCHFLITSTSRAAAVSLENNASIWASWRRDFLPAAPLYPVLAGAAVLVQMLFAPSNLHTFVLIFPVICLFYYCYEFYFGRLRAERRHAQDMSEMHRRTVEALALAMDAKDRVTSGHLRRVQRYALSLGRKIGCSGGELKALEVGALLHDIGKIAVPEYVLSKPGKLTRQEFNQIAIHPQVGAEILAAVSFPFPVAELVHCHHENWDGSGYPAGLKGEQIPLTARILSVVDCFDALISDRPYRPAFAADKAIEMLRSRRGSTFDPRVVDALLGTLPEWQDEWQRQAKDGESQPRLQSPRAIEALQTSRTAEEAPVAAPAGEAPGEGSLRRLLETVGGGLRVEEICYLAFSELGRVLPYEAAAVFLVQGNRLVAAGQTWPQPAGQPPLVAPLPEGPTGWAASQAATLVNGNPLAEPGELGRVARAGQWRDALIVPLWSEGQVIGTLNLYAATPHAYTDDLARLVEMMTANLGVALAGAMGRNEPADRVTALPPGRATLDALQPVGARARVH